MIDFSEIFLLLSLDFTDFIDTRICNFKNCSTLCLDHKFIRKANSWGIWILNSLWICEYLRKKIGAYTFLFRGIIWSLERSTDFCSPCSFTQWRASYASSNPSQAKYPFHGHSCAKCKGRAWKTSLRLAYFSSPSSQDPSIGNNI